MIHPPDLPELISLHGLIVMIGLAVYVAVSHTLHQRRHPSAAMDLAPAASYRSLRIHENGGQALRSLWEQIDAAERTLDLCTYILGRDPMADALCEKLARRARAGVQVRLLIDGVGRLLGPRRNLKDLTAAGVRG